MTPEQFTYWLQGYAELHGDTPPTPEQWQAIREHLQTVFHKVTPPVPGGIYKPAPDHKIQPAPNQAPYYQPIKLDTPSYWPPGKIAC